MTDEISAKQSESEQPAPNQEALKQEAQKQDAPQANDEPSDSDSKLAQKITKIMLIIAGVLLVWHLFADRLTPSTNNARVRAYVVPVVPEVTGKIIQVNVSFSEQVKKGQVLAVIDPREYQNSLEQAEANLELAGQEIGASTEHVSTAEAKLAQQEAQLIYVQQQSSRYESLSKSGLISKADRDKSRAELKKAQANVRAAEAELQKAKDQLGENGQNNPKIRKAAAALRQAHIDLSNTEIRATSDGFVTNVNIDVGQFATPGQPLITMISKRDIWIEAYLRENNLGNLKRGNHVDVALDIAPGRIFKAEVVSLTVGVHWQKNGASASGLPSVPAPGGWLRQAQAFPVILRFSDELESQLKYEGGQAEVTIYTSNNFLLNGLAWCEIRLRSWLSYLY